MDSEQQEAERLDRVVEDLLRGRRLRLNAKDAAGQGVVRMAAAIAAVRHPHPHLSAAARRHLGRRLERQPPAAPGLVTRRTAMAAALGLGTGVAAMAAFAVERHDTGEYERRSRDLVPGSGRWVDVGALADLPEGQPVGVRAGAIAAFVLREGNGVRALSGVCSDLPCLLEPAPGHLLCPCHRVQFDLQGDPHQGYPVPRLARVHARVVDGRVEVLGT